MRKRLRSEKCTLSGGDHLVVYLDEYDTREEAEEALADAVLQHADWAIVEEEVE